jgi:hypothetical protein
VKSSIEISEGGRAVKGEVRPFRPRVVTARVKLRAPAIITVRELYPIYFNHKIERHRRQVRRLGRRKQLGRLSPRFKTEK